MFAEIKVEKEEDKSVIDKAFDLIYHSYLCGDNDKFSKDVRQTLFSLACRVSELKGEHNE